MTKREKLAMLLSGYFNWTVKPENLEPATGAWRTNVMLDVWRWEGRIIDSLGVPRVVGSYQTMTELVKCNSFTIDDTNEICGRVVECTACEDTGFIEDDEGVVGNTVECPYCGGVK